MNELNVQLYLLIGIRALAEYDFIEYRRSTDVSKRELEYKIKNLLDKTGDDEAKEKYNEFKRIEETSESNSELNFLLKQIHSYCFQKAQHLSLELVKNIKFYNQYDSNREYLGGKSVSHSNDFLRLGVMKLLRILKEYEYEPIFEYLWKDQPIDCLLMPKAKGLPYIIIEEKYNLTNINKLRTTIYNQIKSYLKFFGKNSLGILLISSETEINSENYYEEGKIFLLKYDLKKDIFVGENIGQLLNRINEYIE